MQHLAQRLGHAPAWVTGFVLLFRAASVRAEAEVPEATEHEGTSLELSWNQASAKGARRDRDANNIRTPNISAELGLGFLTLPTADVCVQRETLGCAQGDTSIEVNLWPFFRWTPEWSFGAGLTLALLPTTEAPREDPPGVPRDHDRNYFMVEGIARYYPLVADGVELWLAPTFGLVVVSDTFTSREDRPTTAQFGPQHGTNLATEGLTLGGALGLSLAISKHWKVGGYLRAADWFLPEEPKEAPTLDQASLSGDVLMLDFGLSIGVNTPR